MATSLADSLAGTNLIPPVSASSLQGPDVGSKPKSLDDRLDKALSQLDKQQDDLAKSAEETSKGIRERESKRESTEIPKLPDLAAPPKPESRSPLDAFGSAAGWLAVFGSALTRQPLTNALNAAAGVMNAWQKQDMAGADKQFETWKAQTDNAVKLHNFAREYYQDEMDRLKSGDESALNDLKAKGAALKDSTVVTLASLKDRDGMLRHMEAVDKQNEKVVENQAKLIATQEYLTWVASPEGIKATPEQKARKYAEMTNPSVISTEIRTQASTNAKNEKEVDGVNSALEQIGDIRKSVETGGGLGVTGVAGMLERGKETVRTALPGGENAETPASDLQSKVDALQLQLPKLLTGTSKSASDERDKISTILRGLKPGDTKAKTLNALDSLEKLLKAKKDKSDTSSDDSKKYEIGKVITSPDGQKYTITGFDDDGTPLGEPVR